MSESAEIREWARGEGLDVPVKGPLPASIRTAWESRGESDDLDDEEPLVVTVPDLPTVSSAAAGDISTGTATPSPVTPRRAEIPPAGKKVSAADRFRQRIKTTPKTRAKRVSIEDIVSTIWGLGGMALMQNPATVPVGRVLAVQAGVAGIIVEDVAKGTVVDRVLQPLARMEEKGKTTLALLGPPVLVGLITARPELAPVVRPVLKASMMTWLEISGPAMEKAQRKAQKWAEEYGAVDLDAIIDSFWSTEGLPVAESQAEEDAIRRARGDG